MKQAVPIEMMISEFFKIYPKCFAFFLYVIKVPKPKRNCDYYAVAMATAVRSFCPKKHIFLFLKHEK